MSTGGDPFQGLPPEATDAVRNFSTQLVQAGGAPNVVRAVASVSIDAREREARKWRSHFDEQQPRDLDLKKLNFEATTLIKVINDCPKIGNQSGWTFNSVQDAVFDAKKSWESKRRMLSGKPQKIYHDVMCNLGAHSSLFEIIPSSNTYVSVVAGAVKSLVQASKSHRSTVDELTRALKEINDEAQACLTEGALIRSEEMQQAVAKFYIAVFIFYTDAIRWYNSSSGRKVWHSLDESFSDRFTTQLTNIKRLSGLVKRTAHVGSAAEIRVMRLEIEGWEDDVRAGLQGVNRQLAELKAAHEELTRKQVMANAELYRLRDPRSVKLLADELWRNAGIAGTMSADEAWHNAGVGGARLLLEPGRVSFDSRPGTPAGYDIHSSGPSEGTSLSAPPTILNPDIEMTDALRTNQELLGVMEGLIQSIDKGVRLIWTDVDQAVLFDERISLAIERWMRSDKSTMLYLEIPFTMKQPSQMTLAAARVVGAANNLKIPIISYFCETDPDDRATSSETLEPHCDSLLGLVYSLCYQILSLLPPLDRHQSKNTTTLITALGITMTSWTSALRVVQALLESAPQLLLCIIDGYAEFEPQHETQTSELVQVFEEATRQDERLLKVLFTNSRRASSLMGCVDIEQRVVIDGTRRSRFSGGSSPGRAAMFL